MSAERDGGGAEQRPAAQPPKEGTRAQVPGSGLCPRCAHVRLITSQRGSNFLHCLRSRDDARYPKYPPQPVVVCKGFEG